MGFAVSTATDNFVATSVVPEGVCPICNTLRVEN